MIISCEICRSRKIGFIRKVEDYSIYKCLNCSTVSYFPKARRTIILEKNEGRYNYDSLAELAYLSKEIILRKRANLNALFLKTLLEKGNLLDVGCSYGFFMDEMNKAGYSVEGIEPTKKSVNYIKKNFKLPVHQITLENFKVNKKYEVISMIDVIEHVQDPVKEVNKICKMLKTNGILLIQTPNFSSLISYLAANKWFWLLIPEHLHLFNIKSIRFMLSRSNFEVIKIDTWNDKEEFIKNILFVFHLKDKGKTSLIYFILLNFFELIYPLIDILSKITGLGGEMTIYAKLKSK